MYVYLRQQESLRLIRSRREKEAQAADDRDRGLGEIVDVPIPSLTSFAKVTVHLRYHAP